MLKREHFTMEHEKSVLEFGEKSKIVIDQITYAGSAFASTEIGEKVYVKASLVEDFDVFEGDICDATLILNFEDKRDRAQFRAIRLGN